MTGRYSSLLLSLLCSLGWAQQPGPSCAPGEIAGFAAPPAPDVKDLCPANMICGEPVKNKAPQYKSTTTQTSFRLVEHVITVPLTSTSVVAKVEEFVTKRVGQCIVDEPIPAENKTEIVWVDVTRTVANYSTIIVTSTTDIYVGIVENMPCTSTFLEIGTGGETPLASQAPAQEPIEEENFGEEQEN